MTSKIFSRFTVLIFLALIAASTAYAKAGANVSLKWNRNTETNIVGYRVHYGPLNAPYSQVFDVPSNSATVQNLPTNVTYIFAVSAYNTAGVEGDLSAPVCHYVTANPEGGQAVTLDNISSRAFVQSGENVMIGGFIVQGTTPKAIVVRALGPSLTAAGVVGALPDPVLEIHDSKGGLVATNDNWKETDGPTLSALGLGPSDNREASVVLTLPAGQYSAVVHGKGNSRGIALVELYNLDRTQGSVANISTRGRVATGDDVMIGGFIVGGTSPTKMIVRAIGPSLAQQGVSDALLDPTLELYNSQGNLISSNDNWRSTQESAIISSTVPPTDDREAAIVGTLSPGAYSAIIRGQDESEGVALFEVYALDQ